MKDCFQNLHTQFHIQFSSQWKSLLKLCLYLSRSFHDFIYIHVSLTYMIIFFYTVSCSFTLLYLDLFILVYVDLFHPFKNLSLSQVWIYQNIFNICSFNDHRNSSRYALPYQMLKRTSLYLPLCNVRIFSVKQTPNSWVEEYSHFWNFDRLLPYHSSNKARSNLQTHQHYIEIEFLQIFTNTEYH